jgi:microcystin-dependent protein
MQINVDLIYPIGSIYMTTSTVSPAVLFGGTWEHIKGRCIVGVDENDTDFGTVSKTGGEKTHTLTTQGIPSHSHGGLNWAGKAFSLNDGTNCIKLTSQSWSAGNASANYWGTGKTGGDNAHNNLQPYYTAYVWRRIA